MMNGVIVGFCMVASFALGSMLVSAFRIAAELKRIRQLIERESGPIAVSAYKIAIELKRIRQLIEGESGPIEPADLLSR